MIDKKSVEILKRTGLFDKLSDRECTLMFDMLNITEKAYNKREIILHEGETIKSIHVVKRGKVIGEKFHIEGETNLLNIFEEGDVIGLEVISSTFRTIPLTYTADSQVNMLRIPIEGIMSSPLKEVLLENIIRLLSDSNIKQLYKIQVISKHGLRERIISYLKIIERKRGTEVFDIRMTQEQLAQYLCVNRSALSSELNKMRKEGIIDFKKSRFKFL